MVPGRYAQSRYDQVASEYDRLWSRHMEAPEARLTAGLSLSPASTWPTSPAAPA